MLSLWYRVCRKKVAAFGIGATVVCALVFTSVSAANHYHTNCVGHGYVQGSSNTDDAFHARVEAGCGNPGSKICILRKNGATISSASVGAGVNQTCNTFSNYGGNEETSWASVDFNGVFSSHDHYWHGL